MQMSAGLVGKELEVVPDFLHVQVAANSCSHIWSQGLNTDFQLQATRREAPQPLLHCLGKMIWHHLEMGVKGRLFSQKEIQNSQGVALRNVETAVNKFEGARAPLPQLLKRGKKQGRIKAAYLFIQGRQAELAAKRTAA